jgi:predicted HTH transcriptional regulator
VANLIITDTDILSRLENLEDSFVERKTEGDSGDWLKSVVAFANSMPVGYPAILFIGVKNDGTVQGLKNPDSVQKSLSNKIASAYPVPYYWTKVLERGGQSFLAVIVPGRDTRPHFAGPAYVRDGSKSIAASEEQFKILMAQRNNVAYELLKWRGKPVSMWQPNKVGSVYHPSTGYRSEALVEECNQFYVTLRIGQDRVSFSLESFTIGFDHAKNRLEIRSNGPFS